VNGSKGALRNGLNGGKGNGGRNFGVKGLGWVRREEARWLVANGDALEVLELVLVANSSPLGVGQSFENSVDVIDREMRLPRWFQRSRTLLRQAFDCVQLQFPKYTHLLS
jgi:hypothetical protein